MMLVSPSRRRIVFCTMRLLKVGRFWKSGPTCEISSFTTSVTSPSWCTRGVMSMLTPTFLYSNDVTGCWATPPVAMGENDRHRHRHLVAEAGLRGLALHRAELRVGQEARRGVALQQPVDDAGQRS